MRPEDIVARVFDVPNTDVTDASSPETIASWDSMGHIQLITEIDASYGISLTTDDTLRITDVASLKAVLAEHGVP